MVPESDSNSVEPVGEPAGPPRLRDLFDRRVASVYLTAAFSLIAGHFLVKPDVWPGAVHRLQGILFGQEWLAQLAFWALASIVFYVGPASVCAAVVFRMSPLDLGLRLGSLPRHAWVYGLLLAGVLPAVWLSSLRSDFQFTYPFHAGVGLDVRFFIAWEILYVLQFLALEYFFRGFLLFPLEKHLGRGNAIVIMIVPYAMIHFQKPFFEANAAVVAGLILGVMALKTRSVWGGVMLHGTVAVTMDVLALGQKGLWLTGSS